MSSDPSTVPPYEVSLVRRWRLASSSRQSATASVDGCVNASAIEFVGYWPSAHGNGFAQRHASKGAVPPC